LRFIKCSSSTLLSQAIKIKITGYLKESSKPSKLQAAKKEMLDIHITDFYNDVGRILTWVYNNFPRPVTVWTVDICGPDEVDDYGLHSDRYLSCYGAMLWLQEEGFLRFGDVERQDAFNHCVLTQQGFSLLNGFNQQVDGDISPADAIREAMQAGSSSDMEKHIRQLIINNAK
jgi:hypothetical protein